MASLRLKILLMVLLLSFEFQSFGEAGWVRSTIKSVVKIPEKLVKEVVSGVKNVIQLPEKAAKEVVRGVENVIQLPGKVVKELERGVKNVRDGIGNLLGFGKTEIKYIKLPPTHCSPIQSGGGRTGRVQCSGNEIGATCTITCNQGYKIGSHKTVTCASNAVWNGDLTCTAQKCGAPPDVTNAIASCTQPTIGNTSLVGSKCLYKCKSPYVVKRSQQKHSVDCETTGWTKGLPLCVEFKPPIMTGCPHQDIFKVFKTSPVNVTIPHPTFVSGDKLRPLNTTCTTKGRQAGRTAELAYGNYNITCSGFDADTGLIKTCKFAYEVSEPPCPDLRAPDNGALVCGPWGKHGKICSQYCKNDTASNQKFDLPYRGPILGYGQFTCSEIRKGIWEPTNKIFDCVVSRRTPRVILPSRFSYVGQCADATTKTKMRQAFMKHFNVSISTVCPPCTVGNLKITCGQKNGRKRRHLTDFVKRQTSNALTISFETSVPIVANTSDISKDFFDSDALLFNTLLSLEQDLIDDKIGLVSGFPQLNLKLTTNPHVLNFETTVGQCPDGYITSPKGTCSPCFPGSFLNTKAKKCQLCPVGFYSNTTAAMACTKCPDGLTTDTTGARSFSECEEINECESDPCSNGGQCEDVLNGFHCKCAPGFTGTTCLMHDCKDNSCAPGSTCIGENDGTYSCKCPPEQTGEFCNIAIIDGGWTEWSEWPLKCTGGMQTRHRNCSNPLPQNGGKKCHGDVVDSRTCPDCSDISTPLGGYANCSMSNATHKVCSAACNKGYAMMEYLPDVLVCGPETGNLWPHQTYEERTTQLPACSKHTTPQKTSLNVGFQVRGPDCSSQQDRTDLATSIKHQLDLLLKSKPCYTSQKCVIEGVNTCTGPGDSSVVDFTTQVSISSATEEEFQKRLAAADSAIATLAQVFRNKTQGVTVGGKTLYPEATAMTVDLDMTCPPNYVPSKTSLTCVLCPPGTHYDNGTSDTKAKCSYCPRGSYQDKEGQTSCVTCPFARITVAKGSTTVGQCTGILTTTPRPDCKEQDLSPMCPHHAANGLCGQVDVKRACAKSCLCTNKIQ